MGEEGNMGDCISSSTFPLLLFATFHMTKVMVTTAKHRSINTRETTGTVAAIRTRPVAVFSSTTSAPLPVSVMDD